MGTVKPGWSYEKQKVRSREWKKANPGRHAELARAYRARNKEKTKAQNQVNYAIRKGFIERGGCEKCGTKSRVHAHHDDYDKPFEVRWLCYLCHKAEHPVDDDDKSIKFLGATRASVVGSESPRAKLDDELVLKIDAALSAGMSQQSIANAIGVSQSTVSKVKLRKSYFNVKKR